MMEVLLLTNRPAPMIPPIEIIVRWRGLSERLSSFFPELRGVRRSSADHLGGRTASYPASTLARGSPELGDGRAAPQLALADPGQRIRGMRTVEFTRQPVGIPECLVELRRRFAVAGAKHVLDSFDAHSALRAFSSCHSRVSE